MTTTEEIEDRELKVTKTVVHGTMLASLIVGTPLTLIGGIASDIGLGLISLGALLFMGVLIEKAVEKHFLKENKSE